MRPIASLVSLLSLAVLTSAAVTLPGCAAFIRHAPAAHENAPSRVKGVQDIDVQGAHRLIKQGVTVLDVREAHEYQSGHIPQARNLPLSQLDSWAEALDPAEAYVIICRSGKRSAKATEALKAKGFQNLRNVQGGMLDWEAQKLPVTRPE